MITPTKAYLSEVARGISGGAALKLPVQLFKSITTSLSSSTSQTVGLNVGYLGSINSVTLSLRTSAFTSSTLMTDFFIDFDGLRYPLNKSIVGPGEQFYQALASYNTGIATI